MKFGIQLYSLKDFIKENGFEAALDIVKKAGFDCVEFAGFYGLEPQQVVELLHKYGLEGYSAHIQPVDIEKNLPYIDAIGIKAIYVPYANRATLTEKCDELISDIKAVMPILNERGIVFGYHNHAAEYQDGDDAVYRLMDAVDGLTAEVDIFWVTAAGLEPLDILKKYGDKLTAVHVKEMDKRTDIATPREYPCAVVGEGKSNCKAAIEYALKNGVDKFILEVEGMPAEMTEEEFLAKSCANMKKFALGE